MICSSRKSYLTYWPTSNDKLIGLFLLKAVVQKALISEETGPYFRKYKFYKGIDILLVK